MRDGEKEWGKQWDLTISKTNGTGNLVLNNDLNTLNVPASTTLLTSYLWAHFFTQQFVQYIAVAAYNWL